MLTTPPLVLAFFQVEVAFIATYVGKKAASQLIIM
jgi:hypothetical protein